MSDPTTTYREQLERLRAELDGPRDVILADRGRVRDELVALVREIERLIAELEALKEEARPLVERYRELFSREEPASVTKRVDHLGSATYRERGWNALAGADYDRALEELQKAIDLDPENPSNLAMLAWAHLRLENLSLARELLKEVMNRDPEHTIGRVCIGYLRLRESKFAEAIESLSSVLREGTDRTALLYANLYLGMVYAERDMHRDAQSFFRRALELGPNLTEAYWELGHSHRRDGRPDLALEAWKAGAENPYNPWGERCRIAVEGEVAA